jgi:hypothetical protein
MNHSNTVTYTTRGRHSLPPTLALCAPAAWQVREEGEYYIPRIPEDDLLEDEDYDANPALTDVANAHTRNVRDAQRELEDAASLVGVLLDAVEQDSDARAAQTRTVLEFAVECLHNAHHLIDEQESHDRNLCLAYSKLKGEIEEEREDVAPPFDG